MTARHIERVHQGSSADCLLDFRDLSLPSAPVELVPLHELVVRHSPRGAGEDRAYVLVLAELETELPPILVHRATGAVVDGVHRLRAAALRGEEKIKVRWFDGEEEDAALLAVAMNVVHGRPLSAEDRKAAARRIFASRPQWSDRAVAAVTGLSARKVAEIRPRTPAGVLPFDRRIGLDGRSRPLNSAQGRKLAGQLIRDNPHASLRTIAKKAGISRSTVADVRDRLARGDDPVPAAQRGFSTAPRPPRLLPAPADDLRTPGELLTLFDSLRRDPSLRLNEAGRSILRMLDAGALIARERQRIIDSVPPHCKDQVSELMEGCADLWRAFAEELRDQDALAG